MLYALLYTLRVAPLRYRIDHSRVIRAHRPHVTQRIVLRTYRIISYIITYVQRHIITYTRQHNITNVRHTAAASTRKASTIPGITQESQTVWEQPGKGRGTRRNEMRFRLRLGR